MYISLVLLVHIYCIVGSCAKIIYRRNFKFLNRTLDDQRYDKYRSRRKDITSSSECAVLCSVQGCKTFYYDPKENVCTTFISMLNYEFPTVDSDKMQFVQNVGDCNSGWDYYGNTCIFFSNKKRSWHQAKSECSILNGTLVRPDSKDKNTFLKQKARIEGKSFWIGGSAKSENKKSWVWNDGSPLTGYTDWSPGNPNNPGLQNCLQLWSQKGWSWDNDYCSKVKLFICETPVKIYKKNN